MQTTEKYTLFLSRVNGVTEVRIAGLWSYLAFDYANQGQYFIQGDVTNTILVCNEDVGCDAPTMFGAVKIVCIRNPDIYPDKEPYENTLITIFNTIVSTFNNVYAVIEEQTIDFGFYVSLMD